MKITSLVSKNNRIQVFFDEEYAFSCTENFVVKYGLYKDKFFEKEDFEELKTKAQYSILESKLNEYALGGLYSKKELQLKVNRYCQKRFDFLPENSFFEKAFSKLVSLNFYNENSVIKALIQNYISRSKGRNYIYSKLLTKGFAKNDIEEQLENLSDRTLNQNLKNIIEKKAKTLTKVKDIYDLKNKLYKFALGRGFSYGEIKKVVEKLINN